MEFLWIGSRRDIPFAIVGHELQRQASGLFLSGVQEFLSLPGTTHASWSISADCVASRTADVNSELPGPVLLAATRPGMFTDSGLAALEARLPRTRFIGLISDWHHGKVCPQSDRLQGIPLVVAREFAELLRVGLPWRMALTLLCEDDGCDRHAGTRGGFDSGPGSEMAKHFRNVTGDMLIGVYTESEDFGDAVFDGLDQAGLRVCHVSRHDRSAARLDAVVLGVDRTTAIRRFTDKFRQFYPGAILVGCTSMPWRFDELRVGADSAFDIVLPLPLKTAVLMPLLFAAVRRNHRTDSGHWAA